MRRYPLAGSANFVAGVERLARADPTLVARPGLWDENIYLLGVPGGAVDLCTGKELPADPLQFITRRTRVAPAASADCPRWLKFLDEACGGDQELVVYLQRLCGYVLTGDTSEHALVFIHGPGNNGKSVFISTLQGLLGDYATVASMDLFASGRSERHPTEVARLEGARLVTACETDATHVWAEARVKQLTGGDLVTARFMHRDFTTFTPQFKVVIVGNHRPNLRSVDKAIRRRFQLVPFLQQPQCPDRRLALTLRGEWPGILRWAIDGCLAWLSIGLAPPKCVSAATEAYLGTQDTIAHWLAECCIVDIGNPGRYESTSALYQSWRLYAEAAGEDPGSLKAFAETLERRGFPGVRRRDGPLQVRVRTGISLRR
jgi:putative DNA primase/helicase